MARRGLAEPVADVTLPPAVLLIQLLGRKPWLSLTRLWQHTCSA